MSRVENLQYLEKLDVLDLSTMKETQTQRPSLLANNNICEARCPLFLFVVFFPISGSGSL